MVSLPPWAREIALAYESSAAAQFILHGNIQDRHLLPDGTLGGIGDLLLTGLLGRFDIVLTYDPGLGLMVAKGGDLFAQWPAFKETGRLPREPSAAIDLLGHFFRSGINAERLGVKARQVAVVIRAADLVIPASQNGTPFDVASLACQVRDWASEPYAGHAIASFLLVDSPIDLHPLVAANPRTVTVKVPLPDATVMEAALTILAPTAPVALGALPLPRAAAALAGSTLSSVESMLRSRQHQQQAIGDDDLAAVKKQLVERDCGGLIDFIDPSAGGKRRSLDDLHGQEALKAWLRQDAALWRKGDLAAMPMGYLICGPVGTGKTYMVECLAGEAGVPVIKLKNFRDKWVGSTEANLEKIFRLVQALGRCYVFVDEADQALGKRDSGQGDGGLGGRIYAMLAQEMSDTRNRGKIVWILASSRPDLIEVDLKRPGRIDVKIPLFPTGTTAESLGLLRALMKKRNLILSDAEGAALVDRLPTWLTPGAAEALAVKVYRSVQVDSLSIAAAVERAITGYQPPVPRSVLEAQVRLAATEATDPSFVPAAFGGYRE